MRGRKSDACSEKRPKCNLEWVCKCIEDGSVCQPRLGVRGWERRGYRLARTRTTREKEKEDS